MADEGKRAGKTTTQQVGEGIASARATLAPLVWLLFALLAAILAVGALLVALDANKDNSLVTFMLNAADNLDLGVFSRKDGVFTFSGDGAQTKSALVNWGIAALIYLVVGKLLQRVIAP